MGIPGAANPLLLRRAAAAGDDAYQIENSLRFDFGDGAYLSRNIGSSGNRRTWTWAGWIKRDDPAETNDAHPTIWHAYAGVGDRCNFFIDSTSDTLKLYDAEGSVAKANVDTAAVLRDPSAWMHIMCVWDTTQSVEAERLKMYINGKLQTLSGTFPAQNYEGRFNKITDGSWGPHGVGGGKEGSTIYPLNAYLADVHFIDGLALSPAAFGDYSSAGVFNPTAFKMPAPNDGTTWSGQLTAKRNGSSQSVTNPTYAFNGSTSDAAVIQCTADDDIINLIWTPTTAITARTLRIYVHSGSMEAPIHYSISDGTLVNIRDAFTSNVTQWIDVSDDLPANGEITKIELKRDGDTESPFGCALYAVEVDGKILIDGVTDPETRNNPNDGTVWSDTFTGTFHSNGQGNAVNTFDGSLDTQSFGADASTLTFLPPSTITANTAIEIYVYTKGSITGQNDLKVNNSSIFSAVNTALGNDTWGWYDIGTTLNSTHGLVVGRHDNNNKVNIKAIKVDGHILIDGAVDNSFHLKFNDTSLNRYLGKDILNGKIADATGALPIYNTTDAYGDVKGSGNRTDSLSGNLKLAIPGDNVTSTTMDVSTADHDVTVDGVTVSTDESRLYGSSLKFVASETDTLKITGESDFAFGTGDFCVEFWVYNTENKNYNSYIGTRSSTADETGFIIASDAEGDLYVHSNAAVAGAYSGEHVLPLNTWTHVAYTRASGTHRLFMNGIVAANASTTSRDYTNDDICIGANPYDSEYITAYMNDVRVYKGAAKYTANFTPPTRNDFTVNNLDATTPSYNYPIVTKAKVRSVYNGSRSSYYTVDYSDDNSNWTNAFGGVMAASGCDWFDGTVTSGTNNGSYGGHQYWRYVVGANVSHHHPNVNKIALVDIDGTETIIANSGNADNCSDSGFGAAGNAQGTVRGHTYSSGTFALPAHQLDALVDTPTNYLPTGGDDNAGGVTRGNYCTLNPLQKGTGNTLSQGNLVSTYGSGSGVVLSTIGMDSGKWYAEFEITGLGGGSGNTMCGIAQAHQSLTTGLGNNGQPSIGVQPTTGTSYTYDGKGNNLTWSSSAEGDVMMVAVDIDAKKIWVGKNGTWFGSSSDSTDGNPGTGANPRFTNLNDGTYFWAAHPGASGSKVICNFGQRAFKYTNNRANFKALCTQNLDDTFSGEDAEIVNNPSKFFEAKIYNGSGFAMNVRGIDFGPDLVWVKERSGNPDHQVYDQVRGTGKRIETNTNEGNLTQTGGVNAFLSDGWTQGDAGTMNNFGDNYVAWLWDAGTAASGANTNGSINVASGKQFVNDTAGFSITEYTGTGSAATVGHGLSSAPEFIITKRIDGTSDWAVYHSVIGEEDHLRLNQNSAPEDSHYAWNDTAPTASVFSIANASFSGDPHDYIAYCWAPKPGYSAVGKWTGNGSADGPFVYTGFEVKYLLYKGIKSGDNRNWFVHDTSRTPINLTSTTTGDEYLIVNENYQEGQNIGGDINLLSNGFKLRTTNGDQNDNNADFVYIAFASHPFKTARAR